MSTSKAPQTVIPYLILSDVPSFLEFADKVFEATIVRKHQNDEGIIQHAEIQIGNSTIMMGQSGSEFPPMPCGLFVYVKNADKSYEKALAAGASTIMELSNQDYGRTCGVLDPCNNTWWITSIENI